MKKLLVALTVWLSFLSGGPALAADSVCARVSIEIAQELTLERVAFDARLVIHNNLPDKDLENIRVDVTIQDIAGNVKNDLFFVRVSSLDGLAGVSGDGTVLRNSTAEAHWLIIPSPGAGGESSAGVPYFIGATMTYTINGEQTVLPINPDRITVKPTAQLYLDYFMPYAVLGDNPFTAKTEPPIPFPLAVRVLNDGFGPAGKLKIDSAQPKIVDNQQGLLINFRLLGASVNDSAVSPSLTVSFGDVASKGAATADWQMISTLSGRFVSFDVAFTHASELGGELTSLIRETNAHYLVHRIKANLSGRDSRLDFLADTDRDNAHLPDAVFESEIPAGGTNRDDARSPVTVLAVATPPTRPTVQKPEVPLTLALNGNPLGWIYARMNDPSQGLLQLLDVVRADGVHLDPHNFWVEEGLDQDYKPTHTLQFVDYRVDAAAPATYTLVFTQPADDTLPPTSTLVYDGPAVETTDAVYLTPATRILLTAVDNEGGSGVEAMYRQVEGQDSGFVAAVPFGLTTPGSYTLNVYSVDRVGNVEPTKTRTLVVDDAAPELTAPFAATPTSFTPQAPEGVTTARTATFAATASDGVSILTVSIVIRDAAGQTVRTLTTQATNGAPFSLSWDGRTDSGAFVPAGAYTATLTVTDGLGHEIVSETAVTISGWFSVSAVDPVPGANQLHPAADGTLVVWQDDRNGQFDIYLKDLAAAASQRLTADAASQESPAISGSRVVWQDNRNGTWDIYGYDLATGSEFVVSEGGGDQTAPVIAGDWVAWEDRRSGNADIWAKNLVTGELLQITNHERDQLQPVLDGTLLAWVDERFGVAEIYQYDLTTHQELRLTVDGFAQQQPAVSGSAVVWADPRDGAMAIYRAGAFGDATRLSYGTVAQTTPVLRGALLVFTDYAAGASDPNLAFIDLAGGSGGALTTDPARQEEPAIGDGIVVWQDNRDGTWQIYRAALEPSGLPVEVALAPGFNLVAVGQLLVDHYSNAGGLLANGPAVTRTLHHRAADGTFIEARPAAGDFPLQAGSGLIVYCDQAGLLPVANAGEAMSYTLLPGVNHVGILSVPFGYRAYDLLRSLGLDKVVSVRRFDAAGGVWQSAAVREQSGKAETVGSNFPIRPGDGLVITMKTHVDQWKP